MRFFLGQFLVPKFGGSEVPVPTLFCPSPGPELLWGLANPDQHIDKQSAERQTTSRLTGEADRKEIRRKTIANQRNGQTIPADRQGVIGLIDNQVIDGGSADQEDTRI